MEKIQNNKEFFLFLKNIFADDLLRYEETEQEIKLFFKENVMYGNSHIYNLINQIYFRSDFPLVQNGGYRTERLNNEKIYILNKLKDGKRN